MLTFEACVEPRHRRIAVLHLVANLISSAMFLM
jgi:hypothetical protein